MSENLPVASRRTASRVARPDRSAWLFHPLVRSFAIAAAVLLLIALSVVRTYSLGHHQRMYDNPIYRWRESLAIALSRMQTPPLHGYLAYRSIRNYLVEHGLSLVAGYFDETATT